MSWVFCWSRVGRQRRGRGQGALKLADLLRHTRTRPCLFLSGATALSHVCVNLRLAVFRVVLRYLPLHGSLGRRATNLAGPPPKSIHQALIRIVVSFPFLSRVLPLCHATPVWAAHCCFWTRAGSGFVSWESCENGGQRLGGWGRG